MLKLSFLSKGIKKLVPNKFLITNEFHNIIKINSNKQTCGGYFIQRNYFSESNKPQTQNEDKSEEKNAEKKLESDSNDNLKEKLQLNKHEELLKNLDKNIDSKIDSFSTAQDLKGGNSEQKSQDDSSEQPGEKKENINNSEKAKVDDDIEELRKLLSDVYESKMSFKHYEKIVAEYKEKLHVKLLVIILIFFF